MTSSPGRRTETSLPRAGGLYQTVSVAPGRPWTPALKLATLPHHAVDPSWLSSFIRRGVGGDPQSLIGPQHQLSRLMAQLGGLCQIVPAGQHHRLLAVLGGAEIGDLGVDVLLRTLWKTAGSASPPSPAAEPAPW